MHPAAHTRTLYIYIYAKHKHMYCIFNVNASHIPRYLLPTSRPSRQASIPAAAESRLGRSCAWPRAAKVSCPARCRSPTCSWQRGTLQRGLKVKIGTEPIHKKVIQYLFCSFFVLSCSIFLGVTIKRSPLASSLFYEVNSGVSWIHL